MIKSEEQVRVYQEGYQKNKQAYLEGRAVKKSMEEITSDTRRCATLVFRIPAETNLGRKMGALVEGVKQENPELYIQEIPHFTVDCHRYVATPDLTKPLLSAEELDKYNLVLTDILSAEKPFEVEARGLAFGGDGIVMQLLYDHKRLQGLNDRLGEAVRSSVSTMNFIWGMVKNRAPIRIVNLARFTGKEDRDNVIALIEGNKDKEFGGFTTPIFSLLESDHYIQRNNTRVLAEYQLGG